MSGDEWNVDPYPDPEGWASPSAFWLWGPPADPNPIPQEDQT